MAEHTGSWTRQHIDRRRRNLLSSAVGGVTRFAIVSRRRTPFRQHCSTPSPRTSRYCSHRPVPSTSPSCPGRLSWPAIGRLDLLCCGFDVLTHVPSAGGNLSLALLQTLLELRRQNLKIHWLGEDREIPLPAGVAVNSPWMDITLSSPSYESNVPYDYIPAPKNGMELNNRPACAAWPAVPPRRLVYADDDLVLHPLVTLLTAPSWAGAPPVYMCTGWELLADEDKYVASKMHQDGVTVVFEEYEAMPHCFAMLFNHLKNSRRCFGGWAGFIRRAVEKPEAVASSFVTVKARTLKEEPIDVQELSPCTEDEMRERLFQKWAEATSTTIFAKL